MSTMRLAMSSSCGAMVVTGRCVSTTTSTVEGRMSRSACSGVMMQSA